MSDIDRARLDEIIDQAQKRVAGIHDAAETAQRDLQRIVDYWADEIKANDADYVLRRTHLTVAEHVSGLVKISNELSRGRRLKSLKEK